MLAIRHIRERRYCSAHSVLDEVSAKHRSQDAVPAGTSPRYPLNKGLDGQEADVNALEGGGDFEPHFHDYSTCSLVTIQNRTNGAHNTA